MGLLSYDDSYKLHQVKKKKTGKDDDGEPMPPLYHSKQSRQLLDLPLLLIITFKNYLSGAFCKGVVPICFMVLFCFFG
jgi:hypothetical protein